jgi:HlyD family secretion protein
VRVYLSTRVLPGVREGDHAVARLDGYPAHPIPGRVVAISPRAEFTPRIALTEEERADLLFGVKVALSDTTGLLRPGLPATVEFDRSAAR